MAWISQTLTSPLSRALRYARRYFGGWPLGDSKSEGDVIFDGHVRKQGVVLKDGVHAAAESWLGIETFAGHPDFSRSGLLEAGENTKESGFAGAAFAEDGEKFPFRNFERDVAQDDVLAEMLGDGAEGEQRRCAGVA